MWSPSPTDLRPCWKQPGIVPLCQFMLDAVGLPQLQSAFLSLPQHIHYQSSLFSKHILLLFSLFVRTTLIYFPALLFVDISPNLISLPIPILASFVPPHIHLNILIYTTSNFFSCILSQIAYLKQILRQNQMTKNIYSHLPLSRKPVHTHTL